MFWRHSPPAAHTQLHTHPHISLECVSIFAVELCQFNLNEIRSVCVCVSFSLPPPPASFQVSLHLPLCFLSYCCTLRISFLFSSPSPLVIYSSLSDSSLIYFLLLKLGSSACQCMFCWRTCMHAAGCVSTADSYVIMPVLKLKKQLLGFEINK